MTTINGKACVVNGTPVDKVFSNGRQVYGRNLLRDTATQSSDDWYRKNYGWTPDWGTYLGSRAYKTAIAWDNVRYAFSSIAPLINTTDAYTYSIYVKVVGVDPSTISNSYAIDWFSEATSKDNTTFIGINALSGNDWQRINQTFTFTTNVVDLSRPYQQSLRFEVNGLPDGVFIYFAAPKLELGTTATPWTPAPEDVGVKQP